MLALLIFALAPAAGAAHEHGNHAKQPPSEARSGAQSDHAANARMNHAMHGADTEHGYRKTLRRYSIPALELLDQQGRRVTLGDALAADRPQMLNFIFTSCTTICPMLSASFAETRKQLGEDPLQMVSISIDPEYDTPARLARYAERFGVDARQWLLLTGEIEAIRTLQRAFGIDRGNKMNHIPATFLRVPGSEWLRLDGFPSAEDLVREYRELARR